MKLASRPRFSVVIPCYNEECYIGDTLSSLKKQTFDGAYEIIVVDNNSTDTTAKIAGEFGAVVLTEKKPGVCWARQAGTKAARGEIVISTDADTVFSPDWLNKIDIAFKQNPNYVAVAGPCFYRNGPQWGKLYPHFLFRAVNGYAKVFGHPFYITATNIAFNKASWHGYDVHSPQGGDELSLLHQLKKHGRVAFGMDNPVYTSARRLKRGLIYNVFVSFFFYYLIGYYINRLLRHTVIGAAPAYRFDNHEENGMSKLRLANKSKAIANKLNG